MASVPLKEFDRKFNMSALVWPLLLAWHPARGPEAGLPWLMEDMRSSQVRAKLRSHNVGPAHFELEGCVQRSVDSTLRCDSSMRWPRMGREQEITARMRILKTWIPFLGILSFVPCAISYMRSHVFLLATIPSVRDVSKTDSLMEKFAAPSVGESFHDVQNLFYYQGGSISVEVWNQPF